jgi:hypothetical protein
MILTDKKVSPVGKLNREDLEKLFNNFIRFVAPTIAIYFAQLAMGVHWKAAGMVASLALYQALSDFFKKLNNS